MAAPSGSPPSKSVLPVDTVVALCARFDYDAVQERLRDALYTRHCPFAADLVEGELRHVPIIYEDVRRAFYSPGTGVLNSKQLQRAYTRAVYLLLRIYQDGFAYYDAFPTPGDDLFSRYAMIHVKVVGWIAAYAAATAPPLAAVQRSVKDLAERVAAGTGPGGAPALPNPVYVPFMSQASLMGVRMRKHISYNSTAIDPNSVRPTLNNPKLVESQRKGMTRFLEFLMRCDDWAALWALEAVPRFGEPLAAPPRPAAALRSPSPPSPRPPVSE